MRKCERDEFVAIYMKQEFGDLHTFATLFIHVTMMSCSHHDFGRDTIIANSIYSIRVSVHEHVNICV